MTIKFARNTHDTEGNVRKFACTEAVDKVCRTATFSLHMGSPTPLTFSELVEEHRKYDRNWPDCPFGYTIPEMLRGLADLLEADLFKVVEED